MIMPVNINFIFNFIALQLNIDKSLVPRTGVEPALHPRINISFLIIYQY
tara:strand:- start:1188 stop:1334 length:147 start_codon:yes stop_codon:yes gene_type:complete